MIYMKLFVILILVIAKAKSSEYCKICLNHTLCKYPIMDVGIKSAKLQWDSPSDISRMHPKRLVKVAPVCFPKVAWYRERPEKVARVDLHGYVMAGHIQKPGKKERGKIPGPSYACIGYDASALLTRNNIIDILNRINERRNFVALGFFKRFPAAANMRKITWSEDLAWSAQRWVDQCDPDVRPDKHDLCRNLEDKAVGQNIATIFGPSPGLSVKSFVDIWFMQSIDYHGEISFYNRSKDEKTKYYTQLVWAETDSVGCGKAKFNLKYNTVIERLVCNFSPSGNINGKPVYALGIAATQCSDGCYANKLYAGLCSCQSQNRKFTFGRPPPPTSLLRILNLANSSVKQEIDPLKYNHKQSSIGDNESEYHRHHKSRHVVNNNSQAEFSHLLHRVPMLNNVSDSRNFLMHYYNPDKGQSRVYHGHDHRNNFIPPYTSSVEENFRRFDLITQPFTVPQDLQASTIYRRFNQCNQCTRRLPVIVNCNSPVPCVTDKCTRGQNNGCRATRPCISLVQYPHVHPHNKCGCSSSTTCPPPTITTSCCEITCRCPCHVVTTSSPCCPNIARRAEDPLTKDETSQSGELHYYDLFPSLARRSGDLTSEKPPNKDILSTERKMWHLRKAPYTSTKEIIYTGSENPTAKNYEQVSIKFELPHIDKELDYSYGSYNSRKRLSRETDREITYKTFWQINKNEKERPLILKSLQYTTLLNKNRKSWRITHNSLSDETSTEPITIELKNYDDDNEYNHIQHNTEKFLSFDELLRLRKTNSGEFNARRQGNKKPPPKPAPKAPPKPQTKAPTKPTPKAPAKPATKPTPKPTPKPPATTKPATNPPAKPPANAQTTKATAKPPANTSKATAVTETPPKNYTTNTPFQRKKYCTRRLTCTWTVFTATASDGSLLNPGIAAGGGGGSRTPPGYVEGCTRTSTCTRDFMNRNKISTLPMTTLPPGQETVEDEDYCERRSLDVQKRNLNEQPERIFKRQESHGNVSRRFIIPNHTIDLENLLDRAKNNCYYTAEDTRKKRNAINDNRVRCDRCSRKKKEGQYTNPLMSYGDLYYVVLSKLGKFNAKEKNTIKCRQCPCNAGSTIRIRKNSTTLILILLMMNKI